MSIRRPLTVSGHRAGTLAKPVARTEAQPSLLIPAMMTVTSGLVFVISLVVGSGAVTL